MNYIIYWNFKICEILARLKVAMNHQSNIDNNLGENNRY